MSLPSAALSMKIEKHIVLTEKDGENSFYFILDINCYGPIYSEPPPIMSAISCDEQNNVPVPLPRSFEMVPYVETQQPQPVQQQQEEVVESVAASRRLVVLCLLTISI